MASIPLTALPAQAAVTPVAAPHNIEVFPNIDMAGASGYTDPIVMEVWRDGVKVGTTGEPKTADPLEINHSAPDCWAGFTPDIIPGDQIRVLTADQVDVPVEEQVGEYMTVANIDAEPAQKVALDPDGIQNDLVMTGTASTLDNSAALPIAQLGAEIVQPAWRDNGWQRRAIGAVPGLPMPNATTPLPDGGDGVLAYDPVSVTNPLGNHWTATWKNMTEPHATLALSGEQSVSFFERDDGLEGSGLTIMDVEDFSGPATGCPAAVSDSITGSTPAAANLAFVNGTSAMRVEGKAYNAASVRLTLDDSDGDTTDAVTVDAALNNAVSTAETTTPVAPVKQTWTASFPNDAFDALADGDLRISGEFQRVIETSEQRITNPETGEVTTFYQHNPTALPGRAHTLVKDTKVPLAPTAFPAPGRYTSAQAVTITPDDEIDEVVRYRTGDGTQADPTSGSPLVPAPLQVTTTQTVKARSFDKAGNPSPTAVLAYTIGAASVPAAPTGVSATADDASAAVVWTPGDDGGSPVTSWRVQVFTATGTTALRTVTVTEADPTLEPNQLSTVVGSLTNGTAYRFRVAGVNEATGTLQYSALTAPVTPTAPVVPVSAPSVTPASGTYTSAQSVTMTAEAGKQIRYTVGNGTTVPADPTATTGTVYAGPLNVTTSQIIKVVAVDTASGSTSPVVQRNYTVNIPANAAPTVTTRTPAANAVGVAVAGNVTATFSEAVQGVSGTTFTLRSAAGTAVTAAVTYNATTRVATLNPAANLAANTQYTATLTGGATAIRDTANAPLATTSWSFTTGAAPDTTAPTVSTRTPASAATGVSTVGNVTATFSEAVQGVSGTTFTLRNAAGTAIGATVTYNATTRVATLNPTASLAANTSYTATLTGGATAIRDGANNALATSSWSFTTGAAADTTAPTITARTPAVNATGVSTTGNITATFSEAVTGVSGTTFTLRNAAGTAIGATVTYNATTRVATLNPTATLPADARYTVTATGGSTGIRDAANNGIATTSWTFTAGPAPTITARTPGTSATVVSTTGNVTATFSEAVTGVSGTTFTLRNAAGTAIGATVTYNATTRVATLDPTAALAADTRYTATLTGGTTAIRDAAGNPLASSSWSFTTGPRPTVTTRTPAANATGVSRTGNVTATFSEAVTGVSGTTVTLRTSAGAAVTAVVSYNATTRVATLNPSATLAANTVYTATLTGGSTAIRDIAGNALTTTTWNFTTGAA